MWSIAPYDNCCGFLKLMTPNSPLAKGTIPFVLVFSLIGLFSLWVAGDDFYHWYVTATSISPPSMAVAFTRHTAKCGGYS
jgi:hypothetical protein